MHSQKEKAKHWGLFKLDGQEAPLAFLCIKVIAVELTAAHLSLREKVPLVNLDLVLV